LIARTLVPVTLIRGVLYTATAYEDETTYGIATITHMIQRNPAFGRKEKKKKNHIGYQREMLVVTYKTSLFQERSWK